MAKRYREGITEIQEQRLTEISERLRPEVLQKAIEDAQTRAQSKDAATSARGQHDFGRLQQIEAALAFGYRRCREDLESHRIEYTKQNIAPVDDLDAEQRIYERDFMHDDKGRPFQTAKQQWDYITKLEEDYIAKTGYRINANNLLVARDLLRGGLDADSILVTEVLGEAFQAQREANDVKSEDDTLLGIIKNGDLFAERWLKIFEQRLFGANGAPPDFELSPMLKRKLMKIHRDFIMQLSSRQQHLNHQAAKRLLRKAQQTGQKVDGMTKTGEN